MKVIGDRKIFLDSHIYGILNYLLKIFMPAKRVQYKD